MNAIAPTSGALALVPNDMDQAIRLAKAMSTAKLVPKHLQDDVGSCLLVIEQALRWQMSPFAVAQCTSVIGSKLMFEGKLVAAAVETSGVIEGHFDYAFDGEGDARQVTVSARRKGETNPRQLTIKLRDVRTNNEHWKKQPDQMLVYSGTRNWARRFAPAVLLGVYSPEEFNRDGKPVDDFVGTTIDAKADTPAPDLRSAINKDVPLGSFAQEKMAAIDKHKHLSQSWVGAVCKAFIDATTSEEVEELADEVRQRLQRSTTPEANHHIGAAVQAARKRIAAQPKPELPAEDRLPFPGDELVDGVPEPSEEEAPHIKGEEYVAG